MPNKQRIAILMEFPSLLGGERSLLAVIGQLKKQYELFLFAPMTGLLADQIKSSGLNHIPFNIRDEQGIRKSDEVLLGELLPLLSEVDCQIVHGNSVSMARFLGRHRERFPPIVTAHLRDIMKLSARAIQDISCLNRLVAVSEATAKSYRHQGVESDKMQVIYNGIDLNSFLQGASLNLHSELNLHRELNLPCSVCFAVTIGQIGLRKGHDVLIEAISQIANSDPDWHYLIVGERHSTKAESRVHVEKMLESLKASGNEDRVHWLGYRTDVAKILEQAELLIHPARQEPFGRVLLEAAAMGKAIIATDVGGTSEMLVHRESAWLVPPDDARSLSDACNKLMSEPETREQIGSNAKHRISKQFSIEKSARQLALLWQHFL